MNIVDLVNCILLGIVMQVKLKNLPVMILVILTMVGSITAIMTWVNLAPSQRFLDVWVDSFTFAVLVMLPIGGGAFITINKLINQFCSACSSLQKNLLQGVLMAVIMESVMAVITVLNSHGYGSFTQFSSFLFNALLYALPIGLTLSCFMTLVIKPKFEKHLTNVSAQ